jgi:hypothetical protein
MFRNIRQMSWNHLSWYGHVMWREENHLTRRVMNMNEEGWRGRPKKWWIDCVRQDLRVMAVSEDMTSDIGEWTMRTCCADPKLTGIRAERRSILFHFGLLSKKWFNVIIIRWLGSLVVGGPDYETRGDGFKSRISIQIQVSRGFWDEQSWLFIYVIIIIISLLMSPLLGHRPSLWITHKEIEP